MVLTAPAKKPPQDLLDGLASNDFDSREIAHTKLLEWAKSERTSAALLFRISKLDDDPEVRLRSRIILKSLSDRDYLREGKGFLGITMEATFLQIDGKEVPQPGVKITHIVKRGPAAIFGLQVGDTIISMDQSLFRKDEILAEFTSAITSKKPLDKVVFEIVRNGEFQKVEVVLGKHPGVDPNTTAGNLHLLDERARERHFEIWLKKLEREAGK